MTLLQLILLIAIVLAGWPVGRFIASKTREELQAGKRWFKLIVCACIVAIVLSFFFASGENLLLLVASFAFILLLSLASIEKR